MAGFELILRAFRQAFIPLRLATLPLHSPEALARIAREHHLEIIRRRAWVLTGAFSVGEGAYFNPGVLVVVKEWGQLVATIGKRVAIAPGIIFIGASSPNQSHLLKLDGFAERFVKNAPIHVMDDAWLGAGAIILPGITIGTGAVVSAGSVVTKDVPDWAIVAGVPARTTGDVRNIKS
jgi:acetyltransferase-like isoleucine patch superfamily enzyme